MYIFKTGKVVDRINHIGQRTRLAPKYLNRSERGVWQMEKDVSAITYVIVQELETNGNFTNDMKKF